MTRDDLKLKIGLLIAIVCGLATLSEGMVHTLGLPLVIIPWLPWCRLASFVVGVGTAYLGTSPLRGKPDQAPSQSAPDNVAKVAPLILLLIALPAVASAQPVAGDALLSPWSTSSRTTAAIVSDLSVASSLALDTWASWQAPNRAQAFRKQAIRDGAILASAEIVKRLVHRTRPDGSDNLSFFSEHTAFAASALGGARLQIALPLTAATGYFRIAADKHFLTDTIAGALVGGLVGHFTR